MQVQSTSISKCHFSQSEHLSLSEVRNSAKNILPLHLRIHTSLYLLEMKEENYLPFRRTSEMTFILYTKKPCHPDFGDFHPEVSIRATTVLYQCI